MPQAPSVGASQLSSSNLMSCCAEVDADRFQAAQVLLDDVVGRGLQDHLQLRVLVEAVGILAVAAVGGTAAGLHVGDAVGLRTEHAQERFRTHGAGADLHVVGLLNDAAAVGPVLLQLEDDVLKRLHPTDVSNMGAVISLAPRALRSAAPESGANPRPSIAPSPSSKAEPPAVRNISAAITRDSAAQLPTVRTRPALRQCNRRHRPGSAAAEKRALRRFGSSSSAAAGEANMQLRQPARQPHRPQRKISDRPPDTALRRPARR